MGQDVQSVTHEAAASRLLQQVFKLPGFRPGQQQVIEALLAGRSALAIFPTGGGKSLCYQLPALLFDGLTLVVSPLIALMKDQVDALAKLGVRAARLDSSLSAEAVREIYRGIEQGEIKLLYVSPERLKNERFVARLRDPRMRISLLAIDEAHCISEWGHNFRPDYLKLGKLAQSLRVERVLALTATATPAVAADICRQFGIAPADHVQTSFRRPNLHLRVTPCSSRERRDLLRRRIAQQAPGAATIVYVTLQETAEQVAESLRAAGLAAAHYHAGMDDVARTRVQDDFMAGALTVVVATIAFGMGIDKADIRAVYHYNLPKSIENYVQEIGRAGRDGQVSHCEMLVCVDDRLTLENFVYGDTPTRESLAALLAAIDAFDDAFDVSTYELSTPFDIRPLVTNTALTYLELEGVIAATSPSYAEYKIAFKTPRDAVCAQFEGERRAFLEALFQAGQAGRKWLTVNLADVAAGLAQPRERILKALNYLEEQDLIELQASGLRQGYRKPGTRKPSTLLDRMAGLFETREIRDIERIEAVVAFAGGAGCYVTRLLDYFGEASTAPCGVCSQCVDGETQVAIAAPVVELQARELETIHALRRESHAALAQPRQLARFLCGLPSPATARTTLRGHAAFGALRHVPFRQVLAAVEAAN